MGRVLTAASFLLVALAISPSARGQETAGISLEHRADRPSASTGDVVNFTLVLNNRTESALGQVSIVDAPARGFAHVLGSARARVRQGDGQGEVLTGVDRAEQAGSLRLVRFGPFDVPAGAELTVHYQAVVGVDTRPGRYTAVAVAVDPGGVELSSRATARVEVVPDRDFETSTVLGRVFCDVDGDGSLDSGERGVFGARVYLDTGSYAVTDDAGLFHLSRIPAGAHLVKVDADTLGGGKARGEAARLLRLTEGLAEKVVFAVDCAGEIVTGADPRVRVRRADGARVAAAAAAAASAGEVPATVAIAGELSSMQVTIDGAALSVPVASAVPEIAASLRAGAGTSDEGPSLVPVPATGYDVERPSWRLSWAGIVPDRWEFALRPLDAAGALGSPLFSLAGEGQPPLSLNWDGLSDAGVAAVPGLYAAQLTVHSSAHGAEASSAQGVFGIGVGATASGPRTELWTGALFAGTAKAPTASALLDSNIAALVRSLGPSDQLAIEVHWDGTGERLATIARTQREARLVVERLVAAGIAADRIAARGRGSLDPVESSATSAGRQKNRRIVVQVTPTATSVSKPAGVPLTIAAQPPHARVDGETIAVDARGHFAATRARPTRDAIAIDLAAVDGRRARLDVAISPGEPVAPAPHKPAPSVSAAELEILLPPAGVVLAADTVAVSGRTHAGNRLDINGRSIEVSSDGRFAAMIAMSPGKGLLAISSQDADGFIAEIDWPVEIASSQVFLLGLGEAIAASSYTERGWFGETAYLSGMNEDTTIAAGQSLLSGRAVLYLKSRFSMGSMFDRVDLTGHVDTSKRRRASAFFENLMDPTRDIPVYGDTSEEVRDVNGRGKLYLRVTADESSAVVGSVRTSLHSQGEPSGAALLSYERTFDGALVDISRDLGVHRGQLRAFGTQTRTEHARDVNLFRATGGSLYYLRHGRVLEGSEQVRLIVRERDSGLVLSERTLALNEGYTVDYDGGRILLTEPTPSAVGGSGIIGNFDASVMPLDGNPVYLEVTYEHADPAAGGQRAGGVYARDTIAEHLSLGAGGVVEEREGGEDYSLWGVDASLRAGKASSLRAELAGSRERDATNVLSQDGGLSFLDLDSTARTTEGGLGDRKLGWKVSADLAAADLVDANPLAGTRLRVYAQDIERGFSSGGTALDEGRFKYGGSLVHYLTDRDALQLRHEAQVAELPRVGPTPQDVAATDPRQLDERTSALTTLAWTRTGSRWSHRIEAGHQRITTTAARIGDGTEPAEAAYDAQRLAFGAGTQVAYTERVTLRAGQQVTVSAADADPVLMPIDPMNPGRRDDDPLAGITTTIGGEIEIAPGLRLSSDFYQSWNGSNAAQLGFRTPLSPDGGSMFVAERFGMQGRDLLSSTIIGAEDRFGRGGRTYGEYQIDHGVLGQRNRALLGLGQRWQVAPGVRAGFGYEHQQTFGGFLPDGTPIGNNLRNVVAGAADYTYADAFKLAAQAEVRFEQGIHDEVYDALVRDDPRLAADPGGFPDHGGVAPGAPLVLPPGERVQFVLGLGGDWKIAQDLTLFARGRWSRTAAKDQVALGDDGARTAARYLEASVGWAYRPVAHDWLDVIGRYSYVLDRRPLAALLSGTEGTTQAVALIPVVQLPHSFRVSGKLAFKSSRSEARVFEGTENLESSGEAVLGLVRLGYNFWGNWDVTGEYRHLTLFKPADDEQRSGTLWELGYAVARYIRIGAGYNLSRFSDDELALERNSHGFFVRATGQY